MHHRIQIKINIYREKTKFNCVYDSMSKIKWKKKTISNVS